MPRRRVSTGRDDLDRRVEELLDAAGADEHRHLLGDIVATAVRLAGDDVDELDLKITAAAIAEMRRAFRAFAPYRGVPKVTIFGSARTQRDDPAYAQARDVAGALADRGWMVITGAGPGIMAAGTEGAGRDRSFGVNIRLPFEQSANEFIEGDEKLVNMKYFFTRKLELVKESQGFICLPGGFGTLDETFELLTLQQTGKSIPTPIVFLDTPGGHYWESWRRFVVDDVAALGLIDPRDLDMVRITTDVDEACRIITGFYRNFHSVRWVGNTLVVRLRRRPTDDEIGTLNEEFGPLVAEGRIEVAEPLPAEVADDDHLDLARLTLRCDIRHFAQIHALIDRVNRFASAPGDAAPLPDTARPQL